jgi:hypothetical protein
MGTAQHARMSTEHQQHSIKANCAGEFPCGIRLNIHVQCVLTATMKQFSNGFCSLN